MTDHAELIRRLREWEIIVRARDTWGDESDLADGLRDAASQLAGPAREPQTWQSMADAPRDGTWIVVQLSKNRAESMSWGRTRHGEETWCGWDRSYLEQPHWIWTAFPSAPSPSPTPDQETL